MWDWSSETQSDHNIHRGRTAPSQLHIRLQEAAGKQQKAEAGVDRSGWSLPAPPLNPIHHRGSALFSCSSTSREG